MFVDDYFTSDRNHDDDADFEDILGIIRMRKDAVRVSDYYEKVANTYHPSDFQAHFRMTPSAFETLSQVLANTGHLCDIQVHGRSPIPVKKQILMAIWYLANQECYRSVADRFDVTKSSLFRSKNRVIKALKDIGKDCIVWPTASRIQEIQDGFKDMRGFPGVVGAIDGTHISIQKPRMHPSSYLNRKQFHSIVLQAVCDHKMAFTDIYIGWPGSVHDARIFKNSEVYRQANDIIPPQGHLLGDGAYPLSRFVMTPYRDNGYLNPTQKAYNRTHASTRVVIERAFGLLKGKWRCLQHLDLPSVGRICDTVYASCVLHNFVLAADGNCGSETIPLLDSDIADDVTGQQRDISGHHKREYICNSLQ